MFTGGLNMVGVYPEDEVITFESVRQLSRWGFDLKTGQQLWHIDDDPQMNYYGQNEIVYNGLLITSGTYSGKIRAYDIRTGELEWEYVCANIGMESPYGNYPVYVRCVADGKIFTTTSEHSYTHPLYRGRNLRCINATDGTEVWSITDFGGTAAIADGRLVTGNSMDNRIYCYGMGPSGTTVTASPKTSVHGTAVVVEGTVTDQTPTGQRNINDEIDFTLKGTPAISDEDMTAWMEYMFMNQIYPADAEGVEVVLTVVDPNNNVYEIGRTTSDTSGNFGLTFEPLVPGDYQIIAMFEGSRSYGPSHSTTYITVEEAPAATPAPTPPPASVADTYFLPVSIGLIVLVIVVLVFLLILFRRR
jgi:outer membrane protein assembly factor BamB